MNSYYSVTAESVSERIIEKSKFITYVAHVEGEEPAREFLLKLRAIHPMATHVCYGYIADEIGNLQRFSDDGEPQGTAGMPILNVIKARSLMQTVVAVVRYFGGIKLGAGGLTRAYASCAAEGVAASEVKKYEWSVETLVFVDYAQVNALMKFAERYVVVSKRFAERAELTFAVKEGEYSQFVAALQDALSGRAGVKETARYYYAFPVPQSDE